jgi:hypothetical protein
MIWNSITTAIKDGRQIIVRSRRNGHLVYSVVRWLKDGEDELPSTEGGSWCMDDGHDILDYTHWRGLRRELNPPEEWAEIEE